MIAAANEGQVDEQHRGSRGFQQRADDENRPLCPPPHAGRRQAPGDAAPRQLPPGSRLPAGPLGCHSHREAAVRDQDNHVQRQPRVAPILIG